jgi:sugar phosphate isomerase/epimerase
VDYGISTHLYHDRRLGIEHLQEIAAHGFRRVEVFATRTHLDYHDSRATAALGRMLDEAGLTLHSVHAPIVDGLADGRWGEPFSLATADPARRARAVAETEAAIELASVVPYRFLVVHLGVPAELVAAAGPNDARAAVASLEQIAGLASRRGVQLAIENIPNELSGTEALVDLIEETLDRPDAGVCLDLGHSRLTGDVLDAIETVSGLIVTTHVHDNAGRQDDHLVPFEGAIDWSAALTALQKVGYDGTLMFEIAGYASPASLLEKATEARRRFDEILSSGFE